MINPADLKIEDIGRWVIYNPGHGEPERGRIKSWNSSFIFVVYKCDNQWDRFDQYTGCATKPEDLIWLPDYKCNDCGTTFIEADRHIEYNLDCYCGGSISKIKENHDSNRTGILKRERGGAGEDGI